MNVRVSEISCGIRELADVGENPDVYDLARAIDYSVYHDADCVAGTILIASLTTKQKAGIKFLKREGFKAVSRPAMNPNSGNKIVLYMKRLSKADMKRYKKLVD
jgi:hypothetical protein